MLSASTIEILKKLKSRKHKCITESNLSAVCQQFVSSLSAVFDKNGTEGKQKDFLVTFATQEVLLYYIK